MILVYLSYKTEELLIGAGAILPRDRKEVSEPPHVECLVGIRIFREFFTITFNFLES